jgi:dipeptidyl aminopeptidase/acylaminoacyl peptidase
LHDHLQSLGKPHRLVLLPDRGHWLRFDEIQQPAVSFLKENGGSACAANANDP